MLGGADNPNGELPSYITGADNEGLVNLLIRLQTSVFSSHRGAYRRIARDQVSPFFDDWPAVEEKLKVMLSGNELTPEQEALKTALENDD
ncbi:hypothetical protein AHN73_12050 [Salmonella enterica subsp. enterica]|nr:hypothetical protein [Salmonella enterica subsp. enterica]